MKLTIESCGLGSLKLIVDSGRSIVATLLSWDSSGNALSSSNDAGLRLTIERANRHFIVRDQGNECQIAPSGDCKLALLSGSHTIKTEGTVSLSKVAHVDRLHVIADKFNGNASLHVSHAHFQLKTFFSCQEKTVFTIGHEMVIEGLSTGHPVAEVNFFGKCDASTGRCEIKATQLTLQKGSDIRAAAITVEVGRLFVREYARLFAERGTLCVRENLQNRGLFLGHDWLLDLEGDTNINAHLLWVSHHLQFRGSGRLINRGLLGSTQLTSNIPLENHHLIVANRLTYLPSSLNNEDPRLLNVGSGRVFIAERLSNQDRSYLHNASSLLCAGQIEWSGKWVNESTESLMSPDTSIIDMLRTLKTELSQYSLPDGLIRAFHAWVEHATHPFSRLIEAFPLHSMEQHGHCIAAHMQLEADITNTGEVLARRMQTTCGQFSQSENASITATEQCAVKASIATIKGKLISTNVHLMIDENGLIDGIIAAPTLSFSGTGTIKRTRQSWIMANTFTCTLPSIIMSGKLITLEKASIKPSSILELAQDALCQSVESLEIQTHTFIQNSAWCVIRKENSDQPDSRLVDACFAGNVSALETYSQYLAFISQREVMELPDNPPAPTMAAHIQADTLSGNGRMLAPHYRLVVVARENRFNGQWIGYHVRVVSEQALNLDRSLAIFASHTVKIKAPALILPCKVTSPQLSIKTDEYNDTGATLFTDIVQINGHHVDRSSGQKRNSLVAQVTLNSTIKSYKEDALNPLMIQIATSHPISGELARLNARQLIDLTIGYASLNQALELNDSASLIIRYQPMSIVPVFFVQANLISRNHIHLDVGETPLMIAPSNGDSIIDIKANGELQLIAGTTTVQRARMQGKSGADLKLSGRFELGKLRAGRKLSERDVSAYLRQNRGNGLADSHIRSISQLTTLESDGTTLTTEGFLNVKATSWTIEGAAIDVLGPLGGHVAGGVLNRSSFARFGSGNGFSTALWTQDCISQSISQSGEYRYASQYILSQQPQLFFSQATQLNFDILNKGGVIGFQAIGQFNHNRIKHDNVAAYDIYYSIEITRGKRKHRVCGPRSTHVNYINSGYKAAQTSDIPSKPYTGVITSAQGVEFTQHVSSLDVAGAIQAPSVLSHARVVNIVPSETIHSKSRKYEMLTQLDQYFNQVKSLFTKNQDRFKPLYGRESSMSELVERAIADVKLVYIKKEEDAFTHYTRQQFSFEIQELLFVQSLIHLLGRCYISAPSDSDSPLVATLKKTERYAASLPENQAHPERDLYLTEAQLRASIHELYAFSSSIVEGEPILTPTLYLPSSFKSIIEEQPVAYIRSDNRVQFINNDEHSSFRCIGIVESDGDIQIAAHSVHVESRTLEKNERAFLNKKNGYVTVPTQVIDTLSGNIKSKTKVQIEGKTYLQVGGDIRGESGGTFIEMQEAIVIRAQRGTRVDQSERQSKYGTNYAIVPHFVQAKLSGEQVTVLSHAGIQAYGASLDAANDLFIKAEKQISFDTPKETFALPSFDNGKMIGKKVIHGSTQATVLNKLTAGRSIAIATSDTHDVRLVNTALKSGADVEIDGRAVEWKESYCDTYIREHVNKLSGLSYAAFNKEQHSTRALLSAAYVGGSLIIHAKDDVIFSGVCGFIGRHLIVKGKKKIAFTGGAHSASERVKGKSFGISFFGSSAIESMINNDNASQVLKHLLSDIPFIAAARALLVDAKDGADYTVGATQLFLESLSLAMMVMHALDADNPFADFCGSLTDQLGITTSDKGKNRQFNPTVTISFSTFRQQIIQTQQFGCQLIILGSMSLEGDIIEFSNGTRIVASNIKILARKILLQHAKNERHQTGNQQQFSVATKPREGEIIGASYGQGGTHANATDFQATSLTALNRFEAVATDRMCIDGGNITADIISIKTKIFELLSDQDSSHQDNKQWRAGFSMNAEGAICPDGSLSKQRQDVQKTNVSFLKANRELHLFALSVIQAGSLIDVRDGELKVSYLYGQPLLARVQPDASSLAQSFYFLEGENLGSPLQTYCHVTGLSSTELFDRLRAAIHREPVRTYLLDGMGQADVDDHAICSFINTKQQSEPDLFIENSSLFDALYEITEKPLVIWDKDPETQILSLIKGDHTHSNAIHVMAKQSGCFHSLFKTTQEKKLVDWSYSDLNDFKEFRQYAVSLKLTDNDEHDFTLTAKSKRSNEYGASRATVLANTHAGQVLPSGINTDPQAIQATHSKSKSSLGLHVDTERFKKIKTLFKQLGASKNQNDASHQALADEQLSEFKTYIKQLLRIVLNKNDIMIDEGTLTTVLNEYFKFIPSRSLVQHLQERTKKLKDSDPEFKRVSGLLSQSQGEVSDISLGILWVLLDRYQRVQLRPTETQTLLSPSVLYQPMQAPIMPTPAIQVFEPHFQL